MDNFKLQDLLKPGGGPLDPRTVVMHLVSTLLLIVTLLVLRWMIVRAIRGHEKMSREMQRRLLVQVRNGAVLLLLAGLAMIWAAELRTLAVYLFAIAVATVIATKELIQCVTGSIMRAAGGAFTIGDRIEIGDFRGDVIDMNLFTTTIMEIGPNELTHRLTGRAITLPNSIFLSKPVLNESYTDEYVLHVFSVPMKITDDWQRAEEDLSAAAHEQSASYLDKAKLHFEKLSKRQGLVVLSVEPHVTVAVPKADEVELVVRLATPARKKGQIEQAIVRRFLELRTTRELRGNDQDESRTDAGFDSPSLDARDVSLPSSSPVELNQRATGQQLTEVTLTEF